MGQAFQLDGVNDFIDLGNPSSLNPDLITVEAWWNAASFVGTGSDPLVDKGFTSHTAPFYQYHLGVTGDQFASDPGSYDFSVSVGGVLYTVSSTSAGDTYDVGQWNHLAGTYDGETLRLYRNGVLIAEDTTPSGPIDKYASPVTIGTFSNPAGNPALDSFVPGLIDEVIFYDRALSSSEVVESYAAGDQQLRVTRPYSKTVQLTATDGSGLQAARSVSLHIQPAAASPELPELDTGSSLSFDGIDDFVEVPHDDSLHADRQLTVSGWFNVEQLDKQWTSLVYKGDYPDCVLSGCSNREYGLFVNAEGFLAFASTPEDRVDTGSRWVQTPQFIQEGRWYHFAAVIDADEDFMGIYVDGELLASTPYGTSSIHKTSGPLQFSAANFHLNGSLDEVRIHNVALDGQQLRDQMHQTLVGDEPGLVGYWRFDEGQGSTVADLTANGNDGAFVSLGVRSGVSGALTNDADTAFSFNRVRAGGYVDLNIPQVNTTAGEYNTASFWMYWDGTPGVMPFGFDAYDLWISRDSQGSMTLGFNTSNNENYGIDALSSQQPLQNRWVHVTAAFVNDGATTSNKLWIDGVPQTLSMRQGTASIPRTASTNATISGWPGGGYRFGGSLDELALFNGLLTDAEVQTLHAAQAGDYPAAVAALNAIAYYRLGETSGTTATDSSGNLNDGTIVANEFTSQPTWNDVTTAPLYVQNNPSTNSPVMFTVTNSADRGPGSLRDALEGVLRIEGSYPAVIEFNIPITDPDYQDPLLGGTGAFHINLASRLPALTRGRVTIDGWSQTASTGDTNPLGPEIVINGAGIGFDPAGIGEGDAGITLASSENVIRGLNIQDVPHYGIWIDGGDMNVIQGNYLGTDETGSEARAVARCQCYQRSFPQPYRHRWQRS